MGSSTSKPDRPLLPTLSKMLAAHTFLVPDQQYPDKSVLLAMIKVHRKGLSTPLCLDTLVPLSSVEVLNLTAIFFLRPQLLGRLNKRPPEDGENVTDLREVLEQEGLFEELNFDLLEEMDKHGVDDLAEYAGNQDGFVVNPDIEIVREVLRSYAHCSSFVDSKERREFLLGKGST